jgi:hypothetical protein
MNSLHTMHVNAAKRPAIAGRIMERRKHRRHDLESQDLEVELWDGKKHLGTKLGQLIDLSSGGIRIRTNQTGLRPDQQVRLRIALPSYAGISPFIDTSGGSLRPTSDWTGWLAVSRVQQVRDGEYDVAGHLMDMEELNRGMLRLYLSTQPLAA